MNNALTCLTEERLPLREIRNRLGLRFRFLPNGAIYSLEHGSLMLNLFMATVFDGAVGNLYLRLKESDKIDFVPLFGPKAPSSYTFSANALVAQGVWRSLAYQATLQLHENENAWHWQIQVQNQSPQSLEVDFVLMQDLGIANKAAIRNNEYYTSHYIDHTVFEHPECGYLLASRQNLAQDGAHPWLLSGCANGAVGYLTEGLDFFGLSAKEHGRPQVLALEGIGKAKRQYETACHTLQSRTYSLAPDARAECVFFALFQADHPEVTDQHDLERLDLAALSPSFTASLELPADAPAASGNLFALSPLYKAQELTDEDVARHFGPSQRHAEKKDDKLLSFFCGDNTHVVLKAKELLSERPHGHILFSGKAILPEDDTLSATCWMYGVFSSQVTVGNTSFNKCLSLARGNLNLLPSSGQRIFVRRGKGYELLGLPSAFEIGLSHCRWIYKGREETIIVTTQPSPDAPALFTEIRVEGDDKRQFLISHNVQMCTNEYESEAILAVIPQAGKILATPAADSLFRGTYPDAHYAISATNPGAVEALGGDELLWTDRTRRDAPYATFRTGQVNRFTVGQGGNITATGGTVFPSTQPDQSATKSQPRDKFKDYWQALLNRSRLTSPAGSPELSRLNEVMPWFAQNAMIHFTKPYGLEQYSGAAWGTRDVCQGPVEFLLTFQKYSMVREVLHQIFAHQYECSGDWPQWFMFDRYRNIQQADSHGDIIVWPLKAICDYIEATNDFSVMNDNVPYTDADGGFTQHAPTLQDHIHKLLSAIQAKFIPGTTLISYGDGDWNDSLQPVDETMRRQMVSAWTVQLLYQTLNRYARICEKSNRPQGAATVFELTSAMRDDFNRHLVKNGLTAGFAWFNEAGEATMLLHPDENQTGVNYRLLPAIRGVISEMFTPEQASRHFEMIQTHLVYPDGAHLMAPPPEYTGGKSRFFKRAETAAFFGREIGTHYVHAHLRYMEALAKLGQAEELYHALQVINPVGLQECLATANIRQSNCYFSSSDADFQDRYQVQENYAKLKNSQVPVNGGWRIYSSGPGIYLHILISRFLGLRTHFDSLVIDPVLPACLDGLVYTCVFHGKNVEFHYRVRKRASSPEAIRINGTPLKTLVYAATPYRRGGAVLDCQAFQAALNATQNTVEVTL
jgi:cellobiose phosphorylase